jgi:ribose transport system substrate-binding protein
VHKKFGVIAVGLMLAIGVGVAGCSTPGTAGSGATAASNNTPKSKLLGIVSITANEAGNALAIRGATAAAKKAGWTVEVVDAQGDAAKANAAITTFANKKAGMIFDLVFPATSLGAGLAAAKAAGIPVASWGGGPGNDIVMWTGDGGPYATQSATAMATDMKGKGSVLSLNYHGGQVCIDREKAFDQVLAKYPDIKVTKEEVGIPGFLQDAAKFTTAWLSSHPQGSGNLAVWGCWDDPTLGAISAIRQLGRTDVKTYGNAGSITGINAIKDGQMTASAYEEGFKEGEAMFTTTLQAIKAGSSWTPKNVPVPGTLVTKDNVAEFLTSHADVLK